MLLVIAVAKQWTLRTFDVETAFLNGELMKRVLYCWPLRDMKGVDKNRLWLLRKAVFGLTEAPRMWWLRIRNDLLAVGWQELRSVSAVFILKDKNNKLCGILVLHVDDGLICGAGPCYEKSLRAL